MRNLVLAFGMAVAAVSITPAFAVDVMTHLKADHLSNMLKSAGATEIEVTKPEAGVEIVSFNDGTGPVDFILMNCTEEGCLTLQMDTTFEKADNLTLQAVNSFNQNFLNAQAVLLTDGGVALRKLYLANGGFTEANLGTTANVFLASPGLFVTHLKTLVTASLDTKTAEKLATAAEKRAVQLGAAAPASAPRLVDPAKWLANRARRRLPR